MPLLHRPRRTAFALLLLGLACQASPPPDATRAAALASLRTADSALQSAVTARDLPATLTFYAEDAVVMPLAKPSAAGLDAVRKEWEHTFGIPGFANASRLTGIDVSQDGTLGFTRGTYESTMKAPDGELIIERGKWVSIWRRVANGQWRIAVDIFNTDSLPPDHQPSTADTHDH